MPRTTWSEFWSNMLVATPIGVCGETEKTRQRLGGGSPHLAGTLRPSIGAQRSPTADSEAQPAVQVRRSWQEDASTHMRLTQSTGLAGPRPARLCLSAMGGCQSVATRGMSQCPFSSSDGVVRPCGSGDCGSRLEVSHQSGRTDISLV